MKEPQVRTGLSFRAPTLGDWRNWLRLHHAQERVVWLLFPKSKDVRSVTYSDALDEALCWGWIDSIIKRIDDSWYGRKFTPRTNASKWSTVNVTRFRKLLDAGKVQPSGLAVVAPEVLERIRKPRLEAKAPRPSRLASPELDEALTVNLKARTFFETLAPSYRKNYIAWVSSAKQPETRKRRAEEAARLLAKGVKVLLK